MNLFKAGQLVAVFYHLSRFFSGVKFSGDHNFINYTETMTLLKDLGILLGGALLAFCLEFGEFLLVSKTSSLTLSVSSMFKVRRSTVVSIIP